MTYEEKLGKIVTRLKDERDLTRKGHKSKVRFDDHSFTKVRIGEICKILLKLQDDERIIKIIDAFQPTETVATEDIISHNDNDDYNGVEVIDIEVDATFDTWYETYLIKYQSNLSQMNYINLLRVLDAILGIREKTQLNQSSTVVIPLLPQRIIFRELMLADDVGQRDEFCEGRWEAIGYLKKEGVLRDFKHIDSMMHRWDDSIEVEIIPSLFYPFLEKVKQEVAKRLENSENKKIATEQPVQSPVLITKAPVLEYNSIKGVLNIEGKNVKLTKNSFRTKLLELLLKDDKSRNKEWSWDEIIEEIEGINDPDALKDNKSKFYPACDGLSKFIAQKTGINDLLIFNKTTVQINSKYIVS